jgi:hypothetical protein
MVRFYNGATCPEFPNHPTTGTLDDFTTTLDKLFPPNKR